MFELNPNKSFAQNYQVGHGEAQVQDFGIAADALHQKVAMQDEERKAQAKKAAEVDMMLLSLDKNKIGAVHPADNEYFKKRNDVKRKMAVNSINPQTGSISFADKMALDAYEQQTITESKQSAIRDVQERQDLAATKNGKYRPSHIAKALKDRELPSFNIQTGEFDSTPKVNLHEAFPLGEHVAKLQKQNENLVEQAKLQGRSYSNTNEAAYHKAADVVNDHRAFTEMKDQTDEMSPSQLQDLNTEVKNSKFVKGSNSVQNPFYGKGIVSDNGIVDITALSVYNHAEGFKVKGVKPEPVGYVQSGGGASVKPETLPIVTHNVNPDNSGVVTVQPPAGKQDEVAQDNFTYVDSKTGKEKTEKVLINSYNHDANREITGGQATVLLSPEQKAENTRKQSDYRAAETDYNKQKRDLGEEYLRAHKINPPIEPKLFKSHSITLSPNEARDLVQGKLAIEPTIINSGNSNGKGEVLGGARYFKNKVAAANKPIKEIPADEAKMIKKSEEANLIEVHPKTKAEWDNAPKGSFYIDANDKKHIK